MFIQENWKGLVVGAAVMAAAAYGGPAAGRAVGLIAPAVVERIGPTAAPRPSVAAPRRSRPPRATLAQVAKDWGITGRLDCRVVPK